VQTTKIHTPWARKSVVGRTRAGGRDHRIKQPQCGQKLDAAGGAQANHGIRRGNLGTERRGWGGGKAGAAECSMLVNGTSTRKWATIAVRSYAPKCKPVEKRKSVGTRMSLPKRQNARGGWKKSNPRKSYGGTLQETDAIIRKLGTCTLGPAVAITTSTTPQSGGGGEFPQTCRGADRSTGKHYVHTDTKAKELLLAT